MFTDGSTATRIADADRSSAGNVRLELEPEILLPSQYISGFRNDASLRPEKRLMLAVLEEAVADFQKQVVATSREGRRVLDEIEQWVGSEDRSWPFSFGNICDTLGLESSWLRSGLARWRDVQRARHARGEGVVRTQIRRVAGYRSKATGRAVRGRTRSRW